MAQGVPSIGQSGTRPVISLQQLIATVPQQTKLTCRGRKDLWQEVLKVKRCSMEGLEERGYAKRGEDDRRSERVEDG